MPERRRYARVKPTGRLAQSGTIILDVKLPSVVCRIVDLSAGGACLEVSTPANIPKQFVLLYSGTKKTCRVAWRKGWRIGVMF